MGQMLAGVIEVHNLYGGRKVFLDKAPNPGRTIPEHDHRLRPPQPSAEASV